jgi:hypothetical protein
VPAFAIVLGLLVLALFTYASFRQRRHPGNMSQNDGYNKTLGRDDPRNQASGPGSGGYPM